MNECLFVIQMVLIALFALGALKLGQAALTAWVAIQALIANLFVIKQVTLFGFEVTASDAFAIGSLLGLNFLQESFSREAASRATWICFFFLAFFTLASQIHLLYIPSPHDFTHPAFTMLLSPFPRLLIASLSVFFIVQQIDMRFFAFLKNYFPKMSFSLRTLISLLASQFLDTVLFSVAGLYGMVASLVDVIVVSFAIKALAIFFLTFIIKRMKHAILPI